VQALSAPASPSGKNWQNFQLNSYDANSGNSVLISQFGSGLHVSPGLAYVPEKNAVVVLSTDSDENSVVTIVQLTDGSILGNWTFPYYFAVFEFDEKTSQLFFLGMDDSWKNYVLYQLNMESGTLMNLQTFPDAGFVMRGTSTYCPISHTLFIVIRSSNNKYAISRIDTQNKVILGTVTFGVTVSDIIWEYSSETMYAWTSLKGDFTWNFVTLDLQNGNVNQQIASVNPYISHGASVIDRTTNTVTTTMLNTTRLPMPAAWMTVDINSGKVSEVTLSAGFPVSLVCTTQ